MTTQVETPGWGDPGTIRHAEAIGHTVWLVEHGQERDEDVTDALTVAVERSRAARAVDLEKPEYSARPAPTPRRRPGPDGWSFPASGPAATELKSAPNGEVREQGRRP